MTRARPTLLAAVLAAAIGATGATGATGCGGAPRAVAPPATGGVALLPDVRTAKGRPPVVLVSREGDPAGAVAVAVTTAALDPGDDAEPAVALAGVVEARLAAQGFSPIVTPSWDGFRAALLAPTAADASRASAALRAALTAPIRDEDLAGAKKKLAALAARPLEDAALARWAKCVGSPYVTPARAGAGKGAAKSGDDLKAAKLEAWRDAAHALGRVAIGVAGPRASGEAVAAEIAGGPAWRAGSPPTPRGTPTAAAGATAGPLDVSVYEIGAQSPWSQAIVHATIDVGTSSAAVATAEALGDPRGPLATRLAALDTPFRLRELTGAAHARGGCVGVVLEAAPTDAQAVDLPARVADAVALLELEARVHLAEGGAHADGRTLARRAGDAREAAERAAWWALADTARAPEEPIRGSIALAIPTKRGSQAPVETTESALAAAIQRAATAWDKLVVEGRTRVEPGQGEAWVLFASPCGTDAEADVDAGLSALVATTAAEMADRAPSVRVEPWVATDGVGLLVHGPALGAETPAAHARRLADVVGRSLASDPLTHASITRARAELARRDVPAFEALASALAPTHPSWVAPWGREEVTSRAADGAVIARAQALRAGPLRVAVLANADAAQGDAVLRAADRWVDRQGDMRACKPAPAPLPPKPGTYAIESLPGAAPEAVLAYPFPAGDEAAHAAALSVAAALTAERGLLERALSGGLARSWSASVAGWPRSPALMVRVESSEDALDGAVMQLRALVDRLRQGGLPPADQARAVDAASRAALDPRARLVATWRGESLASPRRPAPNADAIRAYATKYLGEDSMIVVAARPGRPPRSAP